MDGLSSKHGDFPPCVNEDWRGGERPPKPCRAGFVSGTGAVGRWSSWGVKIGGA